jgi:UbiD family decarboxylase
LTLRGAAIDAKIWPDDKAYPAAIALGHEPALLAAALLGATAAHADYGLAGYLRGAPVEIIDGESTGLPILAAAEMVLEGVIEARANADQKRPETTGATMKVQRVYFRDDPIVIGNAPFFGAYHGVLASGAAPLWHELERMGVASIVAVNRRPWGVTILAIKQAADGDVQRTAEALMESSAGRDLRYAVIVDDDIDPYNLEKVFWAIVTRYEAQQAVQILRRLQGKAGPTAAPGSAVIIDGCRPFRWLDKFPRTTDISEELMKKTVEKWGKVLERR